jgi:hypothetical protein
VRPIRTLSRYATRRVHFVIAFDYETCFACPHCRPGAFQSADDRGERRAERRGHQAARCARDGVRRTWLLTLRESVLVEGEASQTNTLRWEDYTQTAVDPSDDCTIWYVGDYLKKGATSYSTRIGAYRMPGCN